MCGIAGCVSYSSKDKAIRDAKHMINTIKRRGPDSVNNSDFSIGPAHVAIGHARLSIIDLSDRANQPMTDSEHNTEIVFNGEIYNYKQLKGRLELEGVKFSTTSDTEVLMKAISVWGIEKTLSNVDGMYAFVFFDKETNRVIFARDKFGEKPFYYYLSGNEFVFASQPKAIKAIKPELNISHQAVYNYFKYSYIPAPLSIYENVRKLGNGECLQFKISSTGITDISSVIPDTNNTYLSNTNYDKETFRNLLIKSVEKRCVADVPLSAFLSGGIDSSLTVAIAKKELGITLDTFSMGFDEEEFDESHYAENIAKHIGVPNHIFKMNDGDVIDIFNDLSDIYDEPFCDSSQIPTVFLCKQLKNLYKVSLTGDGGDELVFGYPRYAVFNNRSKYTLPFAARFLSVRGDKQLKKYLTAYNYLVTGDKAALYDYTISRTRELSQLLNPRFSGKAINYPVRTDLSSASTGLSFARNFDLFSYLPDELMVKTDRASMYYGLELRTPFLNQDLFDYINASTDSNYKFENKAKLKSILSHYIPSGLIERPKKGFSVPIKTYLKTSLAEQLFNEISDKEFIKHQGFFNASFLENEYRQLYNNPQHEGYNLWSFLVFQKWYRKYF